MKRNAEKPFWRNFTIWRRSELQGGFKWWRVLRQCSCWNYQSITAQNAVEEGKKREGKLKATGMLWCRNAGMLSKSYVLDEAGSIQAKSGSGNVEVRSEILVLPCTRARCKRCIYAEGFKISAITRRFGRFAERLLAVRCFFPKINEKRWICFGHFCGDGEGFVLSS